jgi:hypothetical protein
MQKGDTVRLRADGPDFIVLEFIGVDPFTIVMCKHISSDVNMGFFIEDLTVVDQAMTVDVPQHILTAIQNKNE